MDIEELADGDETAPVSARLANVVDELTEDDLVALNEDRRTWEVTDIVDQDLGHADDDRLRKRAVRLRTSGRVNATETVFGVLLEEYPGGHEAGVHVLETDTWYEEGQRYELTSIEPLETLVPWVVCRSTGSSSVYHFPDPLAAARGEARPACGGCNGKGEGVEHRIVRVNAVYPAKRACMDCARRHQPREVPKVRCPACDRLIGVGLLHGPEVESVTGVTVACPTTDCSFTGEVPLEQPGATVSAD